MYYRYAAAGFSANIGVHHVAPYGQPNPSSAGRGVAGTPELQTFDRNQRCAKASSQFALALWGREKRRLVFLSGRRSVQKIEQPKVTQAQTGETLCNITHLQ